MGDAFSRSVSLKAAGVPGMLLPEIPAVEVEGLSRYPADPRIEDEVNRGALTGHRTDNVAYVAAEKGYFIIPAHTLQWWNPKIRKVERKEIPGLEFKVVAHAARELSAFGWRFWGAAMVLSVIGGVIIWHYRRALAKAWQRSQAGRQQREAAYFDRVVQACQANDPGLSYQRLTAWCNKAVAMAPIEKPPNMAEHTRLMALSRELQEALLDEQGTWNGAAFAAELKKVREQLLHKKRRESTIGLVPLNPMQL